MGVEQPVQPAEGNPLPIHWRKILSDYESALLPAIGQSFTLPYQIEIKGNTYTASFF